MAPQAIGTGTISFGLVTIPIKIYSANRASESISFNMLHRDCGSRLKQQYICLKDEEVVERSEMVKGYEFSKGQYVIFSDQELKAIEEKATQSIEITEFVPSSTVDPLFFEKAFYLGPDKHGDKAYRLLAKAMNETGRWALARYAARGRNYLVLLRPYQNGLVMQQLHFAREIRSFDEIDIPQGEVKDNELKLAVLLADQASSDQFVPEEYEDDRRTRLEEMIQQKIEGKEISLQPAEEKRGEVIDLMEALKASLAQVSARPQRARIAAKTARVEEEEEKPAAPRKKAPAKKTAAPEPVEEPRKKAARGGRR